MGKGKRFRFKPKNSSEVHTFDSKVELLAYLLLEASPKTDAVIHQPDGHYGPDFYVEISGSDFQVEATSLNDDGTVGARDDAEEPEDYFNRKMASAKLPLVMVFGSVRQLAGIEQVEHWTMSRYGGEFPVLPFYVWAYDVTTGDIIKRCIGGGFGIRRKVAKNASWAVLKEQYKTAKSWSNLKGSIL